MTTLRLRALGAALVVAATFASCGSPGAPAGTPGTKVADVPPTAVPSQLLDLTVSPEDAGPTVARADNTYVKAAGLFSMRKDDVVQGTLEVLTFNSEARLDDPKFRREMVGQIGGAAPEVARLGTDQVFFVRGIKQKISVWFRGRNLLILAVRDDYERPRDLLRATLAVQL